MNQAGLLFRRNLLFFFFLMMFIFSIPAGAESAENLPRKDFLQQVIELVLENNPILQSQRNIIEEIQALPKPGGLNAQFTLIGGASTQIDEDTNEIYVAPSAGIKLEIPLFSFSRRREVLADRLILTKELEKAKQEYHRLKDSIISGLLGQLDKLSQLRNERENLEELKSFLNSRVEALKNQVKAGVAEPSDLWEITERIMNTNIRIQNISSELKNLKRGIALSLGGEKWPELLEMLDQVGKNV